MIRIVLAVVLSLFALSAEAKIPGGTGTTYYVAGSGCSDTNAGTSTSTPWCTLTKSNAFAYACGDTLLFQGGATFNGSITLWSTAGTGTWSGIGCSPSTPFTIGSYGNGKAIIKTANGPAINGIDIYDVSGFVIHDLVLVGPGSGATVNGILAFNDLASNSVLDFLWIYNVDVSGYQDGFSCCGTGAATKGYKNLSITNSRFHHNCADGIRIYGQGTLYDTNYNVYIDKVQSDNNTGACTFAGSGAGNGSGIQINSTTGGVIRRSVANNNGAGAAGGPVGIFAYNSNFVVIELNEAYSNTTLGTSDGDGIDVDGGNLNHIVQYNYVHDNSGAGLLAFTFTGANVWGWNKFRYNISENNGRLFSTTGEMSFGAQAASLPFGSVEVYGNTLRTNVSGRYAVSFTGLSFPLGAGFIYNNIISAVAPASGLLTTSTYNPTTFIFQGNDWDGGLTNVNWNSTPYATIALWRAAVVTQETFRGADTSLISNPLLSSVGNGGTCYTSGIPAGPQSCPSAYLLQAGSPMLNAGKNIFNFTGALAGGRDYYGNVVPASSNGNYDVGANQRTQ